MHVDRVDDGEQRVQGEQLNRVQTRDRERVLQQQLGQLLEQITAMGGNRDEDNGDTRLQ
jgi:hypothetical protein